MSYRPERTFKILIYESEYRQIQAWTNKFENLETGGDLFGLWHDERTAVVQLVLGPGKRCRRTSTSFYQDVEYLRRMGDDLTTDEGLCHIGEWHSHHRLSLTRPSGGDESTIWSNMNRYGLSRFVLCIANICTSWSWSDFSYLPDETTVNGFLFEVARQGQYHRCLPVLQGEFIFLQEESPFRSKYLNVIQEGAESLNTVEDHLRVVVEKCKKMESEWTKVDQENQKLKTSLAAKQIALKEKDKQLDNSEQQVHRMQKCLTAERQVKEKTVRGLHNIEGRAQELEKSLAAERQAKEEAERRLQSILQQAQHVFQSTLAEERHAREGLKAALAEEQTAHKFTERRLRSSEQKLSELKISLAAEQKAHEETRRHPTKSKKLQSTLPTVQQDTEEHRSSQNTPSDWILGRNEIILSQTIIIEGSWGRMAKGKFGRCKVAVKETRLEFLSHQSRSLFEREMRIAFECHHPCLLQFIGATNDDQSPLFVTELLETSLRAVLHERSLEHAEITTIALDVAEGLNYLHLKSPAIVHRNVSSANVLLWRNGNADSWRAKVSNCITDNFLQQSMAASPFDVDNYAAPETRVVFSPKVDVYSFGVLLMEMNIHELPDVENREKQIDKVPIQYRVLVRKCLNRLPKIRPTMEENIEKIKSYQQTWQMNFSRHTIASSRKGW